MNKLFAKAGIFSLLMGVTLYGWAGPCKPIAMSCMMNGYTKDGADGKNLIKDCVLPVVAGKLTLPNSNRSQGVIKDHGFLPGEMIHQNL